MPRAILFLAALLALPIALSCGDDYSSPTDTGNGSADSDTPTVRTVGRAFDPPAITIRLGETVKWIRTSLTHTVTSGAGSGDPDVGALFDAPLSGASPEFTYTFSDTPGVYHYFCRPHEADNMRGSVTVKE